MARVAGFTTKRTFVLEPPASELEAGVKVSHDWVLDADQFKVELATPLFSTVSDCDEVAVLPCKAVKLKEVEVAIERKG